MPPGWRTGKKIFAPAPCQWSSRLPPCCPARPFDSSSPSVATPTTPTIGIAGKRDAVVHLHHPVAHLEEAGQRRLHLLDELTEPGDERGDAPLDRAHVEDFRDERVAGLGALHGDRAGRAVDPREVDLGHEVVLAPDLPGEAVVRLEGDDVAGLDLQHGLEAGPERPDHLVTR